MKWLSKHEQLAGVMRQMIERGEWTGQLPGYRTLEHVLKVHRAVVEKAIEILEKEGVLAPSEPGKRREILKRRKGVGTGQHRSLLFVGPSPIHGYSPTFYSLVAGILADAEQAGWQVAYEHFNFSYPQKAVARLAQLVTDHRPSRLIAMTVIPAFGPWLYRHPLPTFTLGGDMPGYPEWVSSAGISFGRLVEDAGTILRAQGHRRILVPIHAGRTELRNAAIAASAASWAADIPAVELKAMFPFQGQRLPDIHAGFWPRIMPKLRPTAVIVKDHHEYLSLLSYCIRHGIRIPEDLSVVQLSSDANSTWLTPSPDRYEFPVKRICQIVMRWLQQAPNPVGKIHRLSATHVKGGTVATCRK